MRPLRELRKAGRRAKSAGSTRRPALRRTHDGLVCARALTRGPRSDSPSGGVDSDGGAASMTQRIVDVAKSLGPSVDVGAASHAGGIIGAALGRINMTQCASRGSLRADGAPAFKNNALCQTVHDRAVCTF